MHARPSLANDFRRLGVAAGDLIMLHASVRAVGDVAGGPNQILFGLQDALTSDGTLVMFAGCPRYYDEVGRGNLSPEQEREVLEKLPPFDPLTAPSARDHGALVELFRTSPGVRVNHHTARFVFWGRHARYLAEPQPWNLAFGAGSALERLLELDGKILLLGADHDSVTFLHYAEHILDIPGKRLVRYKVPIEEGGRRVWRDQEEIDTASPAHPAWPVDLFARITDGYLAAVNNKGGRVGDAQSYLMSARELLAFALPFMKRLAHE
jgi:aminoglycoside 3-N-acetyltransferase